MEQPGSLRVSLKSVADISISKKVIGVNGYTYSSGCRDYYEHGQKREAALEIREIGDIPTGNDCVDDGLHCPSWLSWFCNFHLDLSCEGWLWFLCGWKMGGTAPCGTCPPYAPPTAPPCCDNSNNNNNNNNDDNGGCSKPPKKCSNCGGANSAGLCSSGPETNCKKYLYYPYFYNLGNATVSNKLGQVPARMINAQAETPNPHAPIAKATLPTNAHLTLIKAAPARQMNAQSL